MTKEQGFVGDPQSAKRRGVVLEINGDRMLVQYFDGTTKWEPAPQELRTPGEAAERVFKSQHVRFDHRSEQEFAVLLDFYEVEWEYEPRTFELDAETEGDASEQFTPDFYLPVFDLYIEISTLNQKLVTRKKSKIRRLLEQYPSLKCKIVFQKDYLNLLTKYGLEDLVGPSAAASTVQAARPEMVEASRNDFKALITAA